MKQRAFTEGENESQKEKEKESGLHVCTSPQAHPHTFFTAMLPRKRRMHKQELKKEVPVMLITIATLGKVTTETQIQRAIHVTKNLSIKKKESSEFGKPKKKNRSAKTKKKQRESFKEKREKVLERCL
jgi:hypothetical protein